MTVTRLAILTGLVLMTALSTARADRIRAFDGPGEGVALDLGTGELSARGGVTFDPETGDFRSFRPPPPCGGRALDFARFAGPSAAPGGSVAGESSLRDTDSAPRVATAGGIAGLGAGLLVLLGWFRRRRKRN
jgi:hypothetical protein